MSEDAKQVLGRRVAIWTEHSHKAVGGDGCRLFELPEANRGIDIVAQDRTAGLLIAGKHQLDRFPKQRLAEPRVPLGAFPYRFTEVFPVQLRLPDVQLLALLRATGKQNDEPAAVPSKIDAVAGAKINPVFESAVRQPL